MASINLDWKRAGSAWQYQDESLLRAHVSSILEYIHETKQLVAGALPNRGRQEGAHKALIRSEQRTSHRSTRGQTDRREKAAETDRTYRTRMIHLPEKKKMEQPDKLTLATGEVISLELEPKHPFFVIMCDGTCYGVGRTLDEAKADASKYTDLNDGSEHRYSVVVAYDEDDAQEEAESEWHQYWGTLLQHHYDQG